MLINKNYIKKLKKVNKNKFLNSDKKKKKKYFFRNKEMYYVWKKGLLYFNKQPEITMYPFKVNNTFIFKKIFSRKHIEKKVNYLYLLSQRKLNPIDYYLYRYSTAFNPNWLSICKINFKLFNKKFLKKKNIFLKDYSLKKITYNNNVNSLPLKKITYNNNVNSLPLKYIKTKYTILKDINKSAKVEKRIFRPWRFYPHLYFTFKFFQNDAKLESKKVSFSNFYFMDLRIVKWYLNYLVKIGHYKYIYDVFSKYIDLFYTPDSFFLYRLVKKINKPFPYKNYLYLLTKIDYNKNNLSSNELKYLSLNLLSNPLFDYKSLNNLYNEFYLSKIHYINEFYNKSLNEFYNKFAIKHKFVYFYTRGPRGRNRHYKPFFTKKKKNKYVFYKKKYSFNFVKRNYTPFVPKYIPNYILKLMNKRNKYYNFLLNSKKKKKKLLVINNTNFMKRASYPKVNHLLKMDYINNKWKIRLDDDQYKASIVNKLFSKEFYKNKKNLKIVKRFYFKNIKKYQFIRNVLRSMELTKLTYYYKIFLRVKRFYNFLKNYNLFWAHSIKKSFLFLNLQKYLKYLYNFSSYINPHFLYVLYYSLSNLKLKNDINEFIKNINNKQLINCSLEFIKINSFSKYYFLNEENLKKLLLFLLWHNNSLDVEKLYIFKDYIINKYKISLLFKLLYKDNLYKLSYKNKKNIKIIKKNKIFIVSFTLFYYFYIYLNFYDLVLRLYWLEYFYNYYLNRFSLTFIEIVDRFHYFNSIFHSFFNFNFFSDKKWEKDLTIDYAFAKFKKKFFKVKKIRHCLIMRLSSDV